MLISLSDGLLTNIFIITTGVALLALGANKDSMKDNAENFSKTRSEPQKDDTRGYEQLKMKSEAEIIREQLGEKNFVIHHLDSLVRETKTRWGLDKYNLVAVDSQEGVQIRMGNKFTQALYYHKDEKLKVIIRLKNFDEDSMGFDPWIIQTNNSEIKRMMLRDDELLGMLSSVSMSVRRIVFEISRQAVVRINHEIETQRSAYNIIRVIMKIMSFKFPWFIVPKPLDLTEVRTDTFKCASCGSKSLDKCLCELPMCFICRDKIRCDERFTQLSCCSNFAHINEIRIWTSRKRSCPFCKAILII